MHHKLQWNCNGTRRFLYGYFGDIGIHLIKNVLL